MAGDKEIDDFNARIAAGKGDATVLIEAATVLLLHDTPAGIETLMLRKNSKIAFGGMWVFPGGRVDDEDGAPGDSPEVRARIAAVREAEEEAALVLDAADLVWFSHWTPPPVEIRRFSTYFFAAPSPGGEVKIDDGEIKESQWITAADALRKHSEKEIELVPPTFVTLHNLTRYATTAEALAAFAAAGPRHYVTQIVRGEGAMVVMWQEDAGYEARDASIEGPRHRLVMTKEGFSFDDSALS